MAALTLLDVKRFWTHEGTLHLTFKRLQAALFRLWPDISNKFMFATAMWCLCWFKLSFYPTGRKSHKVGDGVVIKVVILQTPRRLRGCSDSFTKSCTTQFTKGTEELLKTAKHLNPLHLMLRHYRQTYFFTERHIFIKTLDPELAQQPFSFSEHQVDCFKRGNIKTQHTLWVVCLHPAVVLLFLSCGRIIMTSQCV